MAYGFNEDKSKVAMYSKDDIDNAGYIKVSDIIEVTINGSQNIAATQTASTTITLQVSNVNARKILGVKRVRRVAVRQDDTYDVSPTKDVPVHSWKVYASGQNVYLEMIVTNRSGVAIKVNVGCDVICV